jgi:hypothetical protein
MISLLILFLIAGLSWGYAISYRDPVTTNHYAFTIQNQRIVKESGVVGEVKRAKDNLDKGGLNV